MLLDEKQIKMRLGWFDYTKKHNFNVAKSCRYHGISRKTYYKWLNRYSQSGEKGLLEGSRCPKHIPRKTRQAITDKVLLLRTKYHFGPVTIQMYLFRYHNLRLAAATIYAILKRNHVNRLPKNNKYQRHSKRYKSYTRPTPGDRVQIDVKFIMPIKGVTDKKYYQYTAIDDCTRIRVIRVYDKADQENSIKFFNYLCERLPFRIKTVQTDNGSEFGNLFHWEILDKGINHIHIRPRCPYLNGKVERSHRIDAEEFYQYLNGTVPNDLISFNKIVTDWENFYNFNRPHGSLLGQTPYEKFRKSLNMVEICN